MLPTDQLLTAEESAQVEAALMTRPEKFSTRVAIYALRVLGQIATEQTKPIHTVDAVELAAFLAQDPAMQAAIAAQGMEMDANFQRFWLNLILSAQRPLAQAAEWAGVALADLTVAQIIGWFETQSTAKPR